jgi:hypothetical protein
VAEPVLSRQVLSKSPQMRDASSASIAPAQFSYLQNRTIASCSSFRFLSLLTFTTNRGICFSLKANSNLLKAIAGTPLESGRSQNKRW